MSENSIREYEAGEVIFQENDPGSAMYILREGAVELKKKVEQGERLLKMIDTPNSFFGEMALVDGKPRSATAVAVKKSKLLVVNDEVFDRLILSNGEFALKIIKVLAERIRNTNTELSELVAEDTRERFCRGVTDYAMQHGEKIFNGGIKINIEAMKEWINSYIGVSKKDIETILFRLLKNQEIDYAPTSAKTKDHVVLPEKFVQIYNRRKQA